MMTENAPEQPSDQITQADIQAAEAQEQAELSKAQQKHLQNRVVILRVQANKFQKDLEAAKAELFELRTKLAEYEPAEEVEPEETPESDPENSPEG